MKTVINKNICWKSHRWKFYYQGKIKICTGNIEFSNINENWSNKLDIQSICIQLYKSYITDDKFRITSPSI